MFFVANKIVNEILKKRYDNNGLIKKLCNENMSDEMIIRIITDFIIAAGDTVSLLTIYTKRT